MIKVTAAMPAVPTVETLTVREKSTGAGDGRKVEAAIPV